MSRLLLSHGPPSHGSQPGPDDLRLLCFYLVPSLVLSEDTEEREEETTTYNGEQSSHLSVVVSCLSLSLACLYFVHRTKWSVKNSTLPGPAGHSKSVVAY